MAEQAVRPNMFDLHGHGIRVRYTTTGIAGQPEFHYHDGQGEQDFTGNSIQVVETGIGKLVTVATRRSVDADFTTFTLLVPDIVLAGSEAHFSTLGIVTLHHFLASAPDLVKGPHEVYHSYYLQGVARAVQF